MHTEIAITLLATFVFTYGAMYLEYFLSEKKKNNEIEREIRRIKAGIR